MQLHDTAARSLRTLGPAGDAVSIYVCGITPYDAAHLGHAFTYHVFDVLARRLRVAGHRVRMVRNVTDVDDDILRVSRERGVPWRELVDQQVARFDADMAAIDILPVDAAPRATERVPEMVALVERLLASGAAYERDGWVYFQVASFPRYGDLSHLDRDAMLRLSRERGADPDDPRKRDPLDFVLWQPSAHAEPHWPSPWGEGRPGWHIECSVLCALDAGVPVDVHGGGDDLVYPHHECEVAQWEAVEQRPFARHWLHAAMVLLDGTKMSKSLGNLVFVRDLLGDASAAAVRLMLAAQHPRRAWAYGPHLLRQAREREAAWRAAAAAGRRIDTAAARSCERDLWARLDDDLDTPGAVAVLDELARRALEAPRAGGVDASPLLVRLAAVLGVVL